MGKKQFSSPAVTGSAAVYGWRWMLFQLAFLPSLLRLVLSYLPFGTDSVQLNLLYCLVNFIAVSILFRDSLKASLHNALRKPVKLLGIVAIGLAAYYASTWVVNRAIAAAVPGFFNANDQSIVHLGIRNWLATAAGTVLLAPMAEECFYRGLIFRRMQPANRQSAYLVSMLVFAAVHVIGYIGRYPAPLLALNLIQYFPAGLCLAWAYEQADTIFAPILMHMLINAWSMWRILPGSF